MVAPLELTTQYARFLSLLDCKVPWKKSAGASVMDNTNPDASPIKSDRRRNPASVKANRLALAARLERNRLATLNRLRRTINSHPTIAHDLAQHLPQPPP